MDELERKIVESKKVIGSCELNPNDIFIQATTKTNHNVFNNIRALRLLSGILSILVLVFIGVLIFKDKGNIVINSDGDFLINEAYENEIVKIDNLNTLKKLVSQVEYDGGYFWDEELDADFPTSDDDSITGSTVKPDDGYITNVQIDGVDEEDIVKVNGEYIYYLTREKTEGFGKNALYIFKASNGKLDTVKVVEFDSNSKVVAQNIDAKIIENYSYIPLSLYYTDKYLIVCISENVKVQMEYNNKTSTKNTKRYTKYYILDINTYEEVTKIDVPGTKYTTRLIDNKLYIINRYTDYKNDSDLILPNYKIGNKSFDANDIYYCPGFGNGVNSYLVIFRVTLDDDISVEDFYLVAPRIFVTYMSKDYIAITTTGSAKESQKGLYTVSYSTTQIILINVKEKITFEGIITVLGGVGDRYWIDEYNGYLRVASNGMKSTYKSLEGYRYDVTSEVFNYLTIFSKNSDGIWQEISSVTEGIGLPGESVKSVRFDEKRVTIVTFKQTDPLYYIDLENHYKPVITSELKVTGFSAYQHPYKDNYVIGIGYEATDLGSTTGYKVALYDVSNNNNIIEVGTPLVFSSDYYSSLPAINDPKEIMLNLDNNIFGFSMRKYDNTPEKNPLWGYYVFNIDLSKPNPIEIMNVTIKVNPVTSKWVDTIDRMVYVGDTYYLLAVDEVQIFEVNDGKFEFREKVNLS